MLDFDAELVTAKLDELKTGDGGRSKPSRPFQKSLGSPASKGEHPCVNLLSTLSVKQAAFLSMAFAKHVCCKSILWRTCLFKVIAILFASSLPHIMAASGIS